MLKCAVESGADVYITGDVDHHFALDALEQDLFVIDVGHYGGEKLFIPYMKEYLNRELPDLKVITHPIKSPFFVV